jgi:hypothetical protein
MRRDEAVGLANVVVQTRSENAALQTIERAGSDALDVADLLRRSPDAARHSCSDLRDVRMGVGVAPGSVEEHSDVHRLRPTRICNSSPPSLEARGAECSRRSGAWTRLAARRHDGVTADRRGLSRCSRAPALRSTVAAFEHAVRQIPSRPGRHPFRRARWTVSLPCNRPSAPGLHQPRLPHPPPTQRDLAHRWRSRAQPCAYVSSRSSDTAERPTVTGGLPSSSASPDSHRCPSSSWSTGRSRRRGSLDQRG